MKKILNTSISTEELERNYAVFYHLLSQYDDMDVKFYLHFVREHGTPVMELGAGDGRLAVTIARSGFEVYAVERDTAMLLRLFKNSVGLYPHLIKIIPQDILKMSLERADFSVAIFANRTFQIFKTQEEQLSALHKVNYHLKRGGIIIIDVFTENFVKAIDSKEKEFSHEIVDPITGMKFRVFSTIIVDYAVKNLRAIKHLVSQDNSTEILPGFEITWFSLQDMTSLLEKTQFKIINVFSDFDFTPYHHKTKELIIVAQKKL